MDRTIALLLIAVVIVIGAFAGLWGVVLGVQSGPNPGDYITKSGECWVRPQGDPLYDAHYAQEVNVYNCDAFKVQEQANNLKAETHRTNVETNQMVIAVYSIFGIVGLMLALVTVVVIKGSST